MRKKKIFASVGTHSQQFNRLLQELDSLPNNLFDVFAQAGNSTYTPKNLKFEKFLAAEKFEEKIKWADVVVSHAGAGSIITALKNKKPLVLVPRLKKLNEHTNDHQLELAELLEQEEKAIMVNEGNNLQNAIKKAGKLRQKHSGGKGIEKAIKRFLEGEFEKRKEQTVPSSLYDEAYFLKSCDGVKEFSEYDLGKIPERLEKTIEKSGIKKGQKALDVGCGRGELACFLSKNGIKAFGIDYSKAAVKLAKNYCRKTRSNAVFSLQESERLKFKSEFFDVVFFIEVAEHLHPEQLDRTLKEIHRVLKKGGRVIVHTSPNAVLAKPLYSAIRVLGGKRGDINVRVHVNEQSVYSMKNALKKAGFKSIKVETELKPEWFKASIAYKKLKAIADPLIWVLGTRPIQWLSEKTFVGVFLSTDIACTAEK